MSTRADSYNRAADLILIYAQRTGLQTDEDETQLSDLLADLMHYADTRGLDFAECVDRAERHYTAEQRFGFYEQIT